MNGMLEDLKLVCLEADSALWTAYSHSRTGDYTKLKGLRFPCCRDSDNLRVSEQEARFLFVRALESSRSLSEAYLFSVETPTRSGYRLTGSHPDTANFDLTIYARNGKHRLNGEFKFGGFSKDRKDKLSVNKDIEKLVNDGGDGFWFHLLKKADSKTVSSTLLCIADAIWKFNENSTSGHEKEMIDLAFHICVLDPPFSLHKELRLTPSERSQRDLQEWARFGYTISRGGLQLGDPNGWEVNRKPASSV